jgi:hypothetical protein
MSATSRPLSPGELFILKETIWDNLRDDDVDRWFAQGFQFSDVEGARFGLRCVTPGWLSSLPVARQFDHWPLCRQHSGGPCGVLAAVQGFILYRLLFGNDLRLARQKYDAEHTPSSTPSMATAAQATQAMLASADTGNATAIAAQRLNPGADALRAALAHAVAFVVWQASQVEGRDVTDTLGPRPVLFVTCADGAPPATAATPADGYALHEGFASFEELEAFVAREATLAQLASPCGVVLLVLSVVLSRGAQRITQVRTATGAGSSDVSSCALMRGLLHFCLCLMQRDMDEPAPLVVRFGHSTQELLNLLLTGEAVSGIFDGVEKIGETAAAPSQAPAPASAGAAGGGGGFDADGDADMAAAIAASMADLAPTTAGAGGASGAAASSHAGAGIGASSSSSLSGDAGAASSARPAPAAAAAAPSGAAPAGAAEAGAGAGAGAGAAGDTGDAVMVLRGIMHRPIIGYLSQLEVLRYSQVRAWALQASWSQACS